VATISPQLRSAFSTSAGITPEHKTDADGPDSFYSFATVLILQKHTLTLGEAVRTNLKDTIIRHFPYL